jgi:hypothetical protein
MDYKLISDIKPAPGYRVGGISHIWLLDIADFVSYKFEENNPDLRRMITAIVASSPFIELATMSGSSFTEDCADNVFRQKLSASVEPLSVEISSKLLVASRNKYLILFCSRQGQFFTFGSDGGASLSFTQQTGSENEASGGYTVTIIKNSIYPLFEAADVRKTLPAYIYRPIFSNNTFCQLHNGVRSGYKLANYVLKETKESQALDINGNLCNQSGRKQAIYVLEGTLNPNPNIYEIKGEYTASTKSIGGVSIVVRDIVQCAPYFANSITVPLRQLILSDENNITVLLSSLHRWQLMNPSNIVACSPEQGKAGKTALVFSKTNSEGIANYYFRNLVTQQTVTLNVINKKDVEWVLKNGTWSETGVWLISGIWE